MAEIVYMPKLSDTMVEGVVAGWNKKVGDTVKEGEILAEIRSEERSVGKECRSGWRLCHEKKREDTIP